MQSINPFNQKYNKNWNNSKQYQIDISEILDKVTDSYCDWKETSYIYRAQLMKNLSEQLVCKAEELGKLATLEMGKPYQQAVAEVNKCALVCSFYAEHAESFLQDEVLESDSFLSFISYEPIGAVLAVMPWNYPFWQVFRFLAPTLMAGNVGVLKHASNVPLCAQAIEDLFIHVGFPDNVFTNLPISSDQVEEVIKNDIVQAVSLTGSEKAGSIVSAQSSAQLKPSLLELGGNDAFIVCADAPILKAVEAAIQSRFGNNGQSCIAAKRFFVEEAIYDQFLESFEEQVCSLTVGNPMDDNVDIGPLAKPEFVEELHCQVIESVKMGAVIRVGGETCGELNQFYLPTILENVKPAMPAFEEELFGPVAAIVKVKDVEEAIRLANQSKFGLGGSVWTSNLEKGQSISRKIETGTVAINDFVKSDPRIPFGGIKSSGFGRELGKDGILAFVNKKVIHVNNLL